jgi:cyclic beta-1,2-glucan synthetase
MQRAGVENILGIRREGDWLCVDPCVARGWVGFEVSLRHGSSRVEIRVENPDSVEGGVAVATLNGEIVEERPLKLRLADDGATHLLVIKLG